MRTFKEEHTDNNNNYFFVRNWHCNAICWTNIPIGVSCFFKFIDSLPRRFTYLILQCVCEIWKEEQPDYLNNLSSLNFKELSPARKLELLFPILNSFESASKVLMTQMKSSTLDEYKKWQPISVHQTCSNSEKVQKEFDSLSWIFDYWQNSKYRDHRIRKLQDFCGVMPKLPKEHSGKKKKSLKRRQEDLFDDDLFKHEDSTRRRKFKQEKGSTKEILLFKFARFLLVS